ncbi:MAG: RNA polymerase sigma factor [Acholeplasmataceae bacterium]|nr:MAG: RNA polymerase sigma factor [Acholeplasmataceae bacterium]
MHQIKEIVKQLKVQDQRQFDIFYDATKKAVFYAVAGIIRDENLIEDIMQETYMKFLSNIDKVDENGNVVAYLSMIARNLALDMYNRRKREVYGDDLMDQMPDLRPEPEPDDQEVFKILDLLDDDAKEIVILHVINELKFREIAVIVDKPLGTVLWKYNKAIKTLKGKVGEYL